MPRIKCKDMLIILSIAMNLYFISISEIVTNFSKIDKQVQTVHIISDTVNITAVTQAIDHCVVLNRFGTLDSLLCPTVRRSDSAWYYLHTLSLSFFFQFFIVRYIVCLFINLRTLFRINNYV